MKRSVIFFLLYIFGVTAFPVKPDAELILQETNILVKNGKIITTISYEIKINNRAGEKLANITIPYSKLVKVSNLEASVSDTNGILIKKLQKNDITDRSAISDFSLYEDDYEKIFTLRHNSYPYIIKYSYTEQKEEFIMVDHWIPVTDWKTPTRKAVLSLEVPKAYKISYRSRLTDDFICEQTDENTKYTWTASYAGLTEPQLYSPDIMTIVPNVIIAPVDFKYNLQGSLGTWATFGKWQSSLIKDLSDLPESEKYTIQELIRDINDENQKIKILYKYLQENTRYINVTIETGGLKPYPASYVAENKFGDCKALSNYFKSVLECAGIKSYYTNVNAGDQIKDIDRSFPSQQFNHVILCVPVQKDTLWLDCTSDMAFGYLGTFTQARDVFIVDGENSHFTRTPALTTNDVAEIRKVFFHQNDETQITADFSISYGGDNYETYFSLYNTVNETNRAMIFRNYVVRNGFELIDYKMGKPSPFSPNITFSYSASSGKICKIYGNEIIIEVLPFTMPEFEIPKKRILPVQLDYPVYKSDTLDYEINSRYSLTHKPADQTVKSEYGEYKCVTEIIGSKVRVIKNFTLFPGKYNIEKYNNFYDFISRVKNIENSNRIVANKNL